MGKIIFLIVFVVSAFAEKSYAQELLPVSTQHKWGYIDTCGTISIAPQYDYASLFSNGVAIVKRDQLFGIIDTGNAFLCRLKFDTIYSIPKSLFVAKSDGKWKIIYKNGSLLLNQAFDSVISYNNTLKTYHSGKCGIFDTNGGYITAHCNDITPIADLYYLVYCNNKLGIINAQSNYVLQPIYDNIYSINDTLIRIGSGNKWGMFDLSENILIPPRWNRFDFFKKGYIIGYQDKNAQLIAYPENTLISEDYENYFEGNTDYIVVSKEGKLGIIDRAGKEAVQPLYDDIKHLYDNYFIAENKGKKGIINEKGDTIVSIAYDDVAPFKNDYKLKLFEVSINNLIGLMNDENKQVLPVKFHYIACRNDRYFYVGKSNLCGLYSINGKEVIPVKFQIIGLYDKNTVIARRENCFAIANTDTLLSDAINDKIVIANNVIKLYRGDTLEVININSNGSELERYQYPGIESYQVATDDILPLKDDYRPYSSPSEKPSGLRMRFSAQHGKWGIYDSYSNAFIPNTTIYDRIHNTNHSGYILTEIFTDSTMVLSYAGIDISYNSLFGLVNINNGSEILKNEYISIQIPKAGYDTSSPEYAIHRDGSWQFIDMNKKNSNCIDEQYTHWLCRFHVDGKVEIGDYSKAESTRSFNNFINDITDRGTVWLNDLNAISAMCAGNKYINCKKGKWGYRNDPNSNSSNSSFRSNDLYDYLLPTIPNQNIVSNGENQVGILTSKKQPILEHIFSSIEQPPAFNDEINNDYYITSEIIPTYGYINKKGMLTIDCQYTKANDFSENKAAVQLNKKWGFIDTTGKQTIAPQYHEAGNFHHGLAIVHNDTHCGILSAQGDTLFPISYQSLDFINDTLILFKTKEGFGVMTFNGDTIIAPQFKKPFEFNSNGFAVVRTQDGFGVINRQGKYQLKDKYEKTGVLSENNIIWVKQNGDYKLFNVENGQRLAKGSYKKLLDESCERIAFKENRNYGYLNLNGIIAIAEEYKGAEPFVNYTAIIKKKKLWGVIDNDGKNIIAPEWNQITRWGDYFIAKGNKNKTVLIDHLGKLLFALDSVTLISNFTDGLAVAKNKEKGAYYINTKGENTFNTYFEEALPFSDGAAFAKQHGKWGIIDRKGKWTLPPRFYEIRSFKENIARVMISPLYGTYSIAGTNLLLPQFEELTAIRPDLFLVKKNNKIGYLKPDGTWIWQLQN